jgi:hypothetical protein
MIPILGQGKPFDDDLTTARRLYRAAGRRQSRGLVLLCDRARILARSDRRDDMPT